MAMASSTATIDPKEAAHFGAMASDWWDPKGSSAMLHKLNPVRLSYIREQIDSRWGGDRRGFQPLLGKSALDVGCGAGLLCEPLARMGAQVCGVDAAPTNIKVARAHALAQGLVIDYCAGEIADTPGPLDLVTSMEVIEHVFEPEVFVAQLADRLAPGGLLILSTPNRTALSHFAMITIGEGIGTIPRGTHDWEKFITPEEMEPMLARAGLKIVDRRGIALSLARGLSLSADERLNYLMTAIRAR